MLLTTLVLAVAAEQPYTCCEDTRALVPNSTGVFKFSDNCFGTNDPPNCLNTDGHFAISLWAQVYVENNTVHAEASIHCEFGCVRDVKVWTWYHESRPLVIPSESSGISTAGLAIGTGALGFVLGVGATKLMTKSGYTPV